MIEQMMKSISSRWLLQSSDESLVRKVNKELLQSDEALIFKPASHLSIPQLMNLKHYQRQKRRSSLKAEKPAAKEMKKHTRRKQTTKSTAAKQPPVSTASNPLTGSCLHGLENVGTICYINSGIMALVHLECFNTYFPAIVQQHQCQESCLICALEEVIGRTATGNRICDQVKRAPIIQAAISLLADWNGPPQQGDARYFIRAVLARYQELSLASLTVSGFAEKATCRYRYRYRIYSHSHPYRIK
jgi:hypothetical protein